jgi:transposase
MSRENGTKRSRPRRSYPAEFKQEAVQMLLWKKEVLGREGGMASNLEERVRQLEVELRRVERERDILKKSVVHFQPERIADVYAAIAQLVAG